MIRLRKTDGTAQDLPENCNLVEICDNDGNLAAVVHQRADGRVSIYENGDPEMKRYCESLGLKQTTRIQMKN